ncbi:rhodanese-like domain-containing protein [Limisphaera ngatamarikiensis]|uniref:Rhodanese-like domain-containing protein n=1 Tax=Limisphaera ngatamarikiensis TaxID=1324935 RepID=A0A6M1RR07_9BACT|nr:rhodanese-like domain-containing protein [Limisphaera ngatamarikiensis]NGO39085.1 rhodanese-like domain-containing protein [Limisphaera ngatamarikiensis]
MNDASVGSWLGVILAIVVAVIWLRRSAVAAGLTPEQVRAHLKAGAQVVDVRTPEEYRQGHVSGATNVPLDQIRARAPQVFPDKQRPLLLYCRSGRRSSLAEQELKQIGYTNVWSLGGLDRARSLVESARTDTSDTERPSRPAAGESTSRPR